MPGKIIKKIAEAPAEALEETIVIGKAVAKALNNQPPIQKAEKYWQKLGPGLTTGAADDDPAGIATYSQAGAAYGFKFLGLAPLTFPLMAVVQEMCARIGLVTGRGLAANIKKHFSPRVLYASTILLLIANIFNIGADLGAMAKATQLLDPSLKFGTLVAMFTVASVLMQIFMTYKEFARYLKWLALILFSYVATGFIIDIDWRQLGWEAFIPHLEFSRDGIFLVTGILGTTISPYLFFWQTSQEVEEEILAGKTTLQQRQDTDARHIKDMRIDVWTGMFISNLVMFFIILVSGAVLHPAGITSINTAAQAAEALRPLAGIYAYLLFTLGIIGTGLLAIPILAGSASYAISEAFGWKQGLYRKLKEAYAFYGVIIIAMLVGLALNFIGLDPIRALIYSAVLNGVIAPVILFLIVKISGNPKIMGRWVNNKATHFLGIIVTLLMIVAAGATVLSLLL